MSSGEVSTPQPASTGEFADGPEHALAGGMGSNGMVVRVGETVRRPRQKFSDAVNDYLGFLADVGFAGAPRVLGVDRAGRDVLSWVEGAVGIPPFPDWVADDELLRSVAALQSELHRVSAGYRPPANARWQQANVPPPGPGMIVCHNDLCVENVVVHAGRAVAFIDFDFAAPADPLLDIAVAARHWVPVKDVADIHDARGELDLVARFRRFCDAHRLDADARAGVVAHLGVFLDRALITVKARVDAGQPLYVAEWERGYPAQNRRSRAWIDAHGPAICAGSVTPPAQAEAARRSAR